MPGGEPIPAPGLRRAFHFRPPTNGAASANIPIAARLSILYSGEVGIAIPAAVAAKSAPATCNG
jgi:hypothetical protein